MAAVTLRADSVRINPITTTSRRGALGAFAALSAVAAAPAIAQASPRAAWDAAMARMTKAKAANDQFNADIWYPAYHREKVDPAYTIPESVDELSDRLLDAFINAKAELMEMPAPDLAALRWKLDIALEIEENGELAPWKAHYVAQTLVDYRRLLPAHPLDTPTTEYMPTA